jgi:hypothetical protein
MRLENRPDLLLSRDAVPLFGWTDESTREYIERRPLAKGDRMLIVNQVVQAIEAAGGRSVFAHRV